MKYALIASFAFLALMPMSANAEAPLPRGDVWGTRATDNDYASQRRAHKRMDHEGISSRNDRDATNFWREDDTETASTQRHAKNKKKKRGSSGSSRSAPVSRSLNE